MGGSGPLLVDVPGATPSRLVVAMGKDAIAYLLNRDNLGGITRADSISTGGLQHTYFRQRPPTELTKARMLLFAPTSDTLELSALLQPVHLLSSVGWNVTGQNGCGSPFVTSTDGTNNMIVWVVGAGNNLSWRPAITWLRRRYGCCCLCRWRRQRIDGGTHSYSTTGIVARGRIYVAAGQQSLCF